MKVLSAAVLWLLFALGALVGVVLAVPVFFAALLRGGRAVHKEGVVVKAELIARDSGVGARVAGPCWVRLSGAMRDQAAKKDVLGMVVRMRNEAQAKAAARAGEEDVSVGDQDVLLGTFESFATAPRALETTDAGDYLANAYSSVTPWWVEGMGAMIVRLTPMGVNDRRSSGAMASDEDASVTSSNRLQRLDAAIGQDRARWIMTLQHSGQPIDSSTEIAELRLLERTSLEGHRLRASMRRTGRGLRPVGLRNGIRVVLYPVSQCGRAVRGR